MKTFENGGCRIQIHVQNYGGDTFFMVHFKYFINVREMQIILPINANQLKLLVIMDTILCTRICILNTDPEQCRTHLITAK